VIPTEKLVRLVDRFESIEAEMSSDLSPEGYVKLSKEYSELTPVVAAIRRMNAATAEIADLEEMLADDDADEEMRDMARGELKALKDDEVEKERELSILLLPKDAADEKSAILEVRAGTGGDEAGLFAGALFRMYSRYADLNGWKVEIMSASDADQGGYKEIIASITGAGVFRRLKFESGVHRVQRVPETESGGRIHTSAATVAVLPEAEEVDVNIDDKDLRVDIFRASGPGGQSVKTTDRAVRVPPCATGIVVSHEGEKFHTTTRTKRR